ncbi:hypothetical protein D3C81_1508550 [compost metagenome]
MILAGALGARYQVDTRVLTAEALILGPLCVHPHLVVQITVGGLIAQVRADQLLEVGAFFALGDRGGAVGVEQSGESGHSQNSFWVWKILRV